MFICRVRRKISRMEKCTRDRAQRRHAPVGQNFDHRVSATMRIIRPRDQILTKDEVGDKDES